MTGSIRPRGRPEGRLFVLLVLAVLAGVLGMHALGPGGAPAPAGPAAMERGHAAVAQASMTPHAAPEPSAPATRPAPPAPAPAAVAAQAGEACAHGDGGAGHLAHADRTCAAAGVASAYAPPALTGTAPGAPAVERAAAAAPASAVRGRAPPDLSELQLLRI